jgi:NADH-quinone oxidoreductase subunit M
MSELHLPWLELSVLLPLIGAAILVAIKDPVRSRQVCLMVCGLTLACATGEWIDFTSLKTFEAHDHWDMLEWMFHKDVFVIDELNAPLLPLAALLCLLTVLSTLRTKIARFSFSSALLSMAILLATLSCRQPWVIIALLTIAIFPVWFELKQRGRSTRVFTVHMALFAALLIVGQALVEFEYALAGGALLTVAGLLRTGIVPLHCWMTDLFEKATFGTALLFVTPMTGAYAVMRLVLPHAPDWAMQSIAIVSLVTAVYAGGMAIVQREARRFFCYLFLSHSSLVLVGLELATPIGLTGALCVWLSVGLSLTGFGLTLRSVESRTGRIALDTYHGLYEHMPTLAALFLLTGLASIGFPGTVGFIGIELLIEGAVEVYPLVGMAVVVAAALNGIAILGAYFRLFTGKPHAASFSMRARVPEKIAVLILTVFIIGGGLFPQAGVKSRHHAAKELIRIRGKNKSKEPGTANHIGKNSGVGNKDSANRGSANNGTNHSRTVAQ